MDAFQILTFVLSLILMFSISSAVPKSLAAQTQLQPCFPPNPNITYNYIYGKNDGKPINGTSGYDIIFGTVGDDQIDGKEGDDILCGLVGRDTIRGGIGNDFIQGNEGGDALWGGIGDDTILGGKDNGKIYGEEGNDSISGNLCNDWLVTELAKCPPFLLRTFAHSGNNIYAIAGVLATEIRKSELGMEGTQPNLAKTIYASLPETLCQAIGITGPDDFPPMLLDVELRDISE